MSKTWYEMAIKKRGLTYKEPAKKAKGGLSHEVEKSDKLFEKRHPSEENASDHKSFKSKITSSATSVINWYSDHKLDFILLLLILLLVLGWQLWIKLDLIEHQILQTPTQPLGVLDLFTNETSP